MVIKDATYRLYLLFGLTLEIVNKKGVKIKDFAGANMITANIISIDPM